MSDSDCSLFANNAGCPAVLCFTDWHDITVNQYARDTYCEPLPPPYEHCGTCTNTTLGGACCEQTDYVSCFFNLANQDCAGGAYNDGVDDPNVPAEASATAAINGQATSTAVLSGGATSTAAMSGESTGTPAMSGGTASAGEPTKSEAIRDLSNGAWAVVVLLAVGLVTGCVM